MPMLSRGSDDNGNAAKACGRCYLKMPASRSSRPRWWISGCDPARNFFA
jgi:hypothetical protein